MGLPLVVAHDWFLEPDRKKLLRSQRVPGLYVAYLAVLLGYLLVRNQVTGVMGVPETSFFDNPLVAAEPFLRLATALAVVGRGLLILLAPLTLSPDYSFNAIPLVVSAADPRFLGMVLLLLFVAGGLWWGRGRSRVVPLGVAWYALALLPTSNLLVTVGTIFGDRTLYLPSVAFCLLGGLSFHLLSQRFPRPSLAAASLLLALMGFQTLRYSRAWESDLSLSRWAVREVPNSTKAHHKLGEEQLRAGDLGDGVRSLGRALEIAPENEFAAITLGQARQLIGNRYLPAQGEAARLGRPAPAPDQLPNDPDILYVLAQLTLGRGSPDGAVAYWERALEVEPRHAESSADLGALFITQGDTLGGVELLEEAVRLRPTLARAWLNLGRIHMARRNTPAAREALSRFLSVAGPRFPNEVRWAEGALRSLDFR